MCPNCGSKDVGTAYESYDKQIVKDRKPVKVRIVESYKRCYKCNHEWDRKVKER